MPRRRVKVEAEHILEATFTDAQMKAAKAYVESFEYTTTALYVIAQVILNELEDERAAEILSDAIVDIAEHEAATA